MGIRDLKSAGFRSQKGEGSWSTFGIKAKEGLLLGGKNQQEGFRGLEERENHEGRNKSKEL